MFEIVKSILDYEFMRNALLAGVMVSVACGLIGTLVVLNRIVFLSGGIAHAAYGGVGIAFYLGVDPTIGAVVFSLISSIAMGLVQRKTRQRADTLPGYKPDLMSYLFGSILAVSRFDIWLMLAVALLMIVLVAVLYNGFLAISFDETFARIRGLPVDFLYMLMIVMIGLTVVVSMRVVGLILVIALLSIPPAIAAMFSNSMWRIMLLSISLSILFTVIGLIFSYTWNLTSGATIILVAAAAYLLTFIGKSLWQTKRLQK